MMIWRPSAKFFAGGYFFDLKNINVNFFLTNSCFFYKNEYNNNTNVRKETYGEEGD